MILLKKGYAVLASILLLVTACNKTEVLDNVVMNQEFSLPLGEKALSIDPPVVINLNGNYYYNGRPYRTFAKHFTINKIIDFNLDSVSKIDWIQRVEFKIRTQNSYPVKGYTQVYLLDRNLAITDSVFVNGFQKTEAGTVNILSEPDQVAGAIFETKFEGQRLQNLKTTKYLLYRIHLETWREDGNMLRFTNLSEFKVNVAMRLALRYNLNEL